MQRLLHFVLLVVAVPCAVYWPGHGFRRPIDGIARFREELRAHGSRGDPGTRPPEPEPKPEAEREPEPEAAEPEREPEPDTPRPPTEAPEERAMRLFHAGDFAAAAKAFAGVDEEMRTIAVLGDAFARAFPKRVPDLPYLLIESTTEAKFEGFAEDAGGQLRLTELGGKRMSFPASSIRFRRELERDKALDRIARAARDEGLAEGTKGPRLFALIETACRAGHRDAAAPLLRRALEVDETDPYFLSSVRDRAPTAHQAELYQAFATAQAPRVVAASEEPAVVTTVPRRLDGSGGRAAGGPPELKDPRARALHEDARPLRQEAEDLYRKVVLAGVDRASAADVKQAIRLFDQALAKYEKSMEIEDSDVTFALLRRCSKLNFTLRFMLQQIENR
jgi:tetratricopeptide (TPR) repeat protein